MREVAELVRALRTAGTEFWVEAGRLHVRAPAGVLTPERRTVLTTHRDAVLALVVAETGVHAQDPPDAVSTVLAVDATAGDAAILTDEVRVVRLPLSPCAPSQDDCSCLMNVTCCLCDVELPPRRRYLCFTCAVTNAAVAVAPLGQGDQP